MFHINKNIFFKQEKNSERVVFEIRNIFLFKYFLVTRIVSDQGIYCKMPNQGFKHQTHTNTHITTIVPLQKGWPYKRGLLAQLSTIKLNCHSIKQNFHNKINDLLELLNCVQFERHSSYGVI